MAKHTNFKQVVLQVLARRVSKAYAQEIPHDWKLFGVKSDADTFLWATTHLDPGNFAAVMEAIEWPNCEPGQLRRLGACIRNCQPKREVAA